MLFRIRTDMIVAISVLFEFSEHKWKLEFCSVPLDCKQLVWFQTFLRTITTSYGSTR
jgi:hypothetical protein